MSTSSKHCVASYTATRTPGPKNAVTGNFLVSSATWTATLLGLWVAVARVGLWGLGGVALQYQGLSTKSLRGLLIMN